MPCLGHVWQAQGRRPTHVSCGVSGRAWCQPWLLRVRLQHHRRSQVPADRAAFAGHLVLHSQQMGRGLPLLPLPPRIGRHPVGALACHQSGDAGAASRPGGNRDRRSCAGSLRSQSAASIEGQPPAEVQPLAACRSDDEAAVIADMLELEKDGLRVVWPSRR